MAKQTSTWLAPIVYFDSVDPLTERLPSQGYVGFHMSPTELSRSDCPLFRGRLLRKAFKYSLA